VETEILKLHNNKNKSEVSKMKEYRFAAIRYGQKKLKELETYGAKELKYLNTQLSKEGNDVQILLKEGFTIKQFSIWKEPKATVFVLLLERS
jgi:hypothetical protein